MFPFFIYKYLLIITELQRTTWKKKKLYVAGCQQWHLRGSACGFKLAVNEAQ